METSLTTAIVAVISLILVSLPSRVVTQFLTNSVVFRVLGSKCVSALRRSLTNTHFRGSVKQNDP